MSDLHYIQKYLSGTLQKTRATDLMELMLLNQYNNSPNLKEYFRAFFLELDFLFETVESVYLGRMFEYATGLELDVIGRILGQSRYISIPTGGYFGFQGAIDEAGFPALGFGEEADPNVGGIFRGINTINIELVPLSDIVYRRALLTISQVLASEDASINNAYRAITVLLDMVPETMIFDIIGPREVELKLSADAGTDFNIDLITYMRGYFIPIGTIFTITVV